MKCKNDEKTVNRYLADEMTSKERLSFEAHLQACPNCQSIVKDMELLDNIMLSTPDEDVPDYMMTRILAEARAMEEKKRHGFSLKFVSYGAAVALSLYLGIFTAFWSTATITTTTETTTEVSTLESVEDTFLYSSLMGE